MGDDDEDTGYGSISSNDTGYNSGNESADLYQDGFYKECQTCGRPNPHWCLTYDCCCKECSNSKGYDHALECDQARMLRKLRKPEHRSLMLLKIIRPDKMRFRLCQKILFRRALEFLFRTWVWTWQQSQRYAEYIRDCQFTEYMLEARHIMLLMIQQSGYRLQELGQDLEFGNCPEVVWERADNPHRLEIVFRSWVRIWRLGCWKRKFQHTLDWEPVD